MEPIYGIDLGTSNCLAAQVDELFGTINIECLEDENSNISFPSVVHFHKENEVIVGDRAKELLPRFPGPTVELVKLRLGMEKNLELTINGKKVKKSPQEITGAMLKHFQTLHNNKIKKAVLTVPANFNENQKKAILESGKLAGIDIVEYITEPSAAIMYHLYDQFKDKEFEAFFKEERNFLVFDFGGGTLDLSLINVSIDEKGNLKPNVLITEGDNVLGGNVIDLELTRFLLYDLHTYYYDSFTHKLTEVFDYFYENKRFPDHAEEEVVEYILDVKKNAERAKVQLSTEEVVTIEFPPSAQASEMYANLDLSREVFEEEVLEEKDFGQRVINALENLESENKDYYEIHEIIFVGGSAQIPYFQQKFIEKYPSLKNKLSVSRDYDRAIAMGAAILGAIRNGIEVPPFGLNRCFNQVPHNIFIDHKGHSDLFVRARTKIPFEKPAEKQVRIRHALETNIHIILKEQYGDYDFDLKERVSKEHSIKEVNFYHPFFYTNEEITVTLFIDEHGFINISALHDRTNESVDFKTEKLFQLTDKEFNEAKTRIDQLREIELDLKNISF
ncbi:Hsp70 family protein [Bacillus sp. Marseille-P3661]|uniref:Hsp70 family protein n=1 Tax=Bacillus sp. Marseille-P3661 TaxID=1936234 RepID=UPI000C851B2C|nr:Hsp70 family protein [Bacillus sp. Marseille-P3661]